MYETLATLSDSHQEKVIFHTLLSMFWFDKEHNTVKDAACQSCPNYIGPKRDNPESLYNQPSVYSFFPEGDVVWNVL